jgi:hypothetical protein
MPRPSGSKGAPIRRCDHVKVVFFKFLLLCSSVFFVFVVVVVAPIRRCAHVISVVFLLLNHLFLSLSFLILVLCVLVL